MYVHTNDTTQVVCFIHYEFYHELIALLVFVSFIYCPLYWYMKYRKQNNFISYSYYVYIDISTLIHISSFFY